MTQETLLPIAGMEFQAALGAATAALDSGSTSRFIAAADSILRSDRAMLNVFDGAQPPAGIRLSSAIRAAAGQVSIGDRRVALFGIPVSGPLEKLRKGLIKGHLVESMVKSMLQAELVPGGFEIVMLRSGIPGREMLTAGPSEIRAIAEALAEGLNAGEKGADRRSFSIGSALGVGPRREARQSRQTVTVLGLMVAPAGWKGHWVPNNPLGNLTSAEPPLAVSAFVAAANEAADPEINILPPGDWDTCLLQLGMDEVDRALFDEGEKVMGHAFAEMAVGASQAHLFSDLVEGSAWIAKSYGPAVMGPVCMPLAYSRWRPNGVLGLLALESEAVHVHHRFTEMREALGRLH